MHSVKIKRSDLLSLVKENRVKHRELFLKAQTGYRDQAIAELDAMLSEARDGKRIRRAVELDEPIDQTREYDRIIAMLEMSVDDIVELSATEFDQYARDNWAWSAHVLSNNSKYIGR